MSDNQEEFDALRKEAAYPFVNEHGKDAEGLRHVCEDFMRRWRETRGSSGKSEQDDRNLVDSVVRWTMNRYNRPRYRPKRQPSWWHRNCLPNPEKFTVERRSGTLPF